MPPTVPANRNPAPRRRSAVVAALLLLVVAGTAAAQDAQYWTNQFGNQARLLGGSTIGSASDLSAVYYNPGRLTLTENPELVLAGTAYQLTNITLRDPEDLNFEISTTRAGGASALFAGEIRLKGKNHLAYSFLTRQKFDVLIEERADLSDSLAQPLDLLTASIDLDESMSEYWIGLTWARPLTDRLGVGVSGYVLTRSQRSRRQSLVQAGADTAAGVAFQRENFNYSYWGLIAKVGVGGDLGAWSVGLTVTTPNLKVLGKGATTYDESVVSDDLNAEDSRPSYVVSDYQDNLPATYNSPWAIGAGGAYSWRATTIHLAAEWFAPVDGYRVLDPAPIVVSDSVAVRTMDVVDKRDAVLNVGVGVEHRFNPDLHGYASFRTDFNSVADGAEVWVPVSTWDIYHIGTGVTFSFVGAEFTLGGIYAFGRDTGERQWDLIPGDDDRTPLSREMEARFARLTAIFGFSIGL